MMEVNQARLIKILYSSFYISHYSDQKLSVPELSIDLYKLMNLYQDEMDKSLKEFDGYSIENIEKDSFQKRQKRLHNKLDELMNLFKNNTPQPIGRGISSREKSDEFSDQDDGIIENAIIANWCDRYSLLGGTKSLEFQEGDLQIAKEKLIEIARYKIKLEAMKQVSDTAALEGAYNYSRTFEKVADACREIAKELEEPTFKKYLKEVRSERIIIKKDGVKVSDPTKLYNQTYSWWQNQREKGDEIPKE